MKSETRNTHQKILLTGPLGSGKSLAIEHLRQKGFHCIQADDLAKKLLMEHPAVQTKASELFGQDVFQTGVLNKPLFIQRFFADHDKKQQYQDFLYPMVQAHVNEQAKKYERVVVEVPMLFESLQRNPNAYADFNLIISIESSAGLRKQRIQQRDGRSDREIQTIMAAQADSAERQQIAHHVIINDGSLAQLYDTLDRIIQ